MRPIGVFFQDDAREIHQRVLGQQQGQNDLNMQRKRMIQNPMYFVKLESDLSAATNPYTGYTQATGQIIRYVQPTNPTSLDMEDSTLSVSTITVTNRFGSFSATTGQAILVVENGSEWSPIPTGVTVQEGLVSSCFGNGWYEVELGTFNGSPVDADSYTDTCDFCAEAEITNQGQLSSPLDSCEASGAIQIDRLRPTGLGIFVFAHTAKRLPYLVGGHVRLLPIHASPSGEQYYTIVDGEEALLKSARPDYECCDGVVTLIGCSYDITPGVNCPGWTSDCPSSGNS